jgi:hypothetical protein
MTSMSRRLLSTAAKFVARLACSSLGVPVDPQQALAPRSAVLRAGGRARLAARRARAPEPGPDLSTGGANRARDEYHAAIAANAGEPVVHKNLAVLPMAQGRLPEAAAELPAEIAVNPTRPSLTRRGYPRHSQMLKSPFGVDVRNVQFGLVAGQSRLFPQAMNVGAPSPGHINCCRHVTVPLPLPSSAKIRQQFNPPGQSLDVMQGRSIFSQPSFW